MDDIFIKVVGVGGGGISAVNHMCSIGMGGVEFVAIDTDARSLSACKADYKLNIAEDPAEQPGAGGSPETGEKAARANRERIQTALRGAGLVMIVAGLGGGTGTGASCPASPRRTHSRPQMKRSAMRCSACPTRSASRAGSTCACMMLST